MIMLKNVGVYSKAIVGMVAAALSALTVALGDGLISNEEWFAVLLAALGSLGLVYVVPNARSSDAEVHAHAGPHDDGNLHF
jgi:hypothetical protein